MALTYHENLILLLRVQQVRFIQGAAASNVTRGYVVLNGVKSDPIVAESGPVAEKRPLWFVMAGMGAQWHEMGRDMLRYETFRR